MGRKKLLIIGFGSVGKKHFDILKKNYSKKINVFVYSKLTNKNFDKSAISEIKNINPDFFILSTPSYQHYKQLKLLNDNFRNKTILCEKPLFLKNHKLKPNFNKIFIGYNLRFHPVLKEFKKIFKNKKVDAVDIHCSTNVIKWRKPKKDYVPYSFLQNKGGGVLFDLSHEIDYFLWIFGIFKVEKKKFFRNSDNKIVTAKNIFFANGTNDKCKKVTFYMNFMSNKEKRYIKVYYNKRIFYGDLKKNQFKILQNNKILKIKTFKNFNIIQTFKEEIEDIFFTKKKMSCNLVDGLKLTKKLVEMSL